MFQKNSFLNHLPSLAFLPWPRNCILKRFQAIFLDFMANWENLLFWILHPPKMHHHFSLGLKPVTNSEDKVPVIGIVTLPRIPFKHSLAYSKTIKPFTLTLSANLLLCLYNFYWTYSYLISRGPGLSNVTVTTSLLINGL